MAEKDVRGILMEYETEFVESESHFGQMAEMERENLAKRRRRTSFPHVEYGQSSTQLERLHSTYLPDTQSQPPQPLPSARVLRYTNSTSLRQSEQS